ncbi:hypothetical protein ACFY8Z_27105 [Streptomyces microflavus]|uniref:hypothetical protein n=1 Tax=Streptomyces microflavus TaxID=1919 RepID=UPI0036EA95EC
MIPEFDVDICVDYDLAALRTGLSAEDVAGGFTEHHEYECLGLPSWEQAEECLKEEAAFLERAGKSDAPDGLAAIFYELQEADDIGYVELMAHTFYWNDVGVAGLSLALSAARVATFYSCSSGLGHRHHARYPMVGAVPDLERAGLLARLITQAGCGVGQESGRWYIYGRSVGDTHNLGKAILDARDAFEALPEPSWTEGLAELLEELADE